MGSKSRVDIITDLKKGEKLNPSSSQHEADPWNIMIINKKRSIASVDVGDGATQERCIPIPRRVDTRPMAMRTRWMNFSMAVGMQRMGDRPMGACTRYLGDDLDNGAIHPSQWKMTKRQRTRIRPMVVGTRHADFDPRTETNAYLKLA